MAKAKKSAKVTGDSLEEAVQTIETAILRESPSYSDRTFQIEPKKIITVDGVRHEIDLCVIVDHGNGYIATFIFECKNWKKKIGKSHIIEFSEKVKVVPAQKGFFVAKSFTRYARAQAKKDPRIELLCAEELDLTEVPSYVQAVLKSFHILKVISRKVQIRPHLKCVHDPARSFTGAVEFLVDDAPVLWDEYLNTWVNETIRATCSGFRSLELPEGTYPLAFDDLRSFDNRNCLLNGEPVDRIEVSGIVQVHIARPSIIESQFEIANRGRVYHVVSRSPFIEMKVNIHQLMTQIRLGANDGKEWTIQNPVRLFLW